MEFNSIQISFTDSTMILWKTLVRSQNAGYVG